MPRIGQLEDYTNPVDGLRPSDKGIEASVQEGRRIGLFYHQIGQDIGGDIRQLGDMYVRHQDQQALSAYSATAAGMDASFHQGLNSYLSSEDPSNPGHANGERHGAALDYYNNYAKQFDQVQNHAFDMASPEARLRMQEHGQSLSESWKRTALATQSDLDRTTSMRQFDVVSNAGAAATYAGADLDKQLDLTFQQIKMMSHNLSQDDYAKGEEFRTEAFKVAGFRTVKGAIDGAAAAGTPDGFARARQILADPKYDQYIGEQKGELSREIDAAEQRAQRNAREQVILDRQAKQAQSEAAVDDIMKGWFTGPGGQPLSTPSFRADDEARWARDPRLTPEGVQKLQALKSAMIRGVDRDEDQPILGDLYRKAAAGTLTEADILDGMSKVGPTAAGRMYELDRQLKSGAGGDKSGLNRIKTATYLGLGKLYNAINGRIMSVAGQQSYNSLLAWTEQQLAPHPVEEQMQMLDPNSPKYLYTPSVLDAFKVSPSAEMDFIKGIRWVDRQPGEGVVQWRKDQYYIQRAQMGQSRAQIDRGWAKFLKDHPNADSPDMNAPSPKWTGTAADAAKKFLSPGG